MERTNNTADVSNFTQIFEKKLFEYAEENLERRHNGTFRNDTDEFGKLLPVLKNDFKFLANYQKSRFMSFHYTHVTHLL